MSNDFSTSQQRQVTLEDAVNIVNENMRIGNYRVAKIVLEDILKAQPDHAQSNYNLGLAMYFMGDVNQALIYIGKSLEDKDAPEAEWWCNFGIMLNEVGRFDDAIAAYDSGIALDPEYPNTYWNKSHTFWLAERYEEGEEAARKGLKINDQIPETWLNLGTSLVQQDKKQEAIEAWEKALEIDSDFALALNNLGNVTRDEGELEKSEEYCRKALEIDPKQPQAMNNLGNVLIDRGQIEEAESWYRKAILEKPDYFEAHNNLAIAFINQNHFADAINQARIAISYNPEYAQAMMNLCIAYRMTGQLEEAQSIIQKAAVIDPESPEIRLELADILLMFDRFADAEIELEKAKGLAPNSPQVYMRLANVLERANKIDQALEAIDKAVEENPEMPEAYMRKGNICHISNRIDEAKEYFYKALEMNPDMPQCLLLLSDLYLTIGDKEKAEEYVRKVEAKIDNFPGMFSTLSKVKKFTEDDEDFKKMLKMKEEIDKFGLDQKSYLHFALFSAYEDIKDYKKAFESLKIANDSKREIIPYDTDTQRGSYEMVLKGNTAEGLSDFDGKGFESDIPVFIVGMPRSGTTLTEQIISSHKNVYGAGELLELTTVESSVGLLNPDTAVKQGEWYVDQVQKRDKTGKALRVTDKMPGNFANIGKIACILPNAKIIHCRRNPIDTCLSCYKQNFARGQYWSYNLEELGHYYNMYLDMMAHWREHLGDRFIEVDYEKTVDDIETEARRMIDYIGLPWDDACLQPHKQKRAVLTASKMQVIKPVYKTSVKAWMRYEEELQPLIKVLESGPAKELL